MKFVQKKTDTTPVYLVHEASLCGFKPLRRIMDSGVFKGKIGETHRYLTEKEDIFFIGAGPKNEDTAESLQQVGYYAGKALNDAKLQQANVKFNTYSDLPEQKALRAFMEGLYLSMYRFDQYLSDKEPRTLKEISFQLQNEVAHWDALTDAVQIDMQAVALTRNLVNEPARVIYPATLAQAAKEALEPYGVKVTVYDEKQIEAIGMAAYLSVARGSAKPPRLIVMTYNLKEGVAPLALVGKGMTYDSGGYSIKPSDSMKTMQSDMAGAATVIGAMQAIARHGIDRPVVAVVAACENMVSGDSYKPGDIIGSLMGKTIEVDNTDAEGRLTLADAVTYVTENYTPEAVVDLATLTGACVVALGDLYTGVVANDEALKEKVLAAAKEVDEKMWAFPMDNAYKELNKSQVADIKNSGGRWGGAISAGYFVGEFVTKDTPWAHLDIAGTAFLDKSRDIYPFGATGHGVKTLVALVKK